MYAFRIPPNMFYVACSTLKGLQPRHPIHPQVSIWCMCPDTPDKRPGLEAIAMYISTTPVAIRVLACRASTPLLAEERDLPKISTDLWVSAPEFCEPSTVTQTSSMKLYPRYGYQPQPPRYSHQGAYLNEQSWIAARPVVPKRGSVGLSFCSDKHG